MGAILAGICDVDNALENPPEEGSLSSSVQRLQGKVPCVPDQASARLASAHRRGDDADRPEPGRAGAARRHLRWSGRATCRLTEAVRPHSMPLSHRGAAVAQRA